MPNDHKKLNRDSETQIDSLCKKLVRRQVCGSLDVTLETAKLLRNVVSSSRWNNEIELKELIGIVADRLSESQPIELAVKAISKRILQIVSEEQPEPDEDYRDTMKTVLRQGIAELVDEQETCSVNIASQAIDYIHNNEIILTIGSSKVVSQFLKEAARFRKFQVIIAETAPLYVISYFRFQGHEIALELAKADIATTVIADCALFAIMSRVNKVILGAHAVTANGGIVAVAGSKVVAAAARHHSTPVVVCAPLHTLSPIYPYDTGAFNLCTSPQPLFDFKEMQNPNIDATNPLFDYIAPDLLSLFITNVGPHPPSYIQRLVAEHHEY